MSYPKLEISLEKIKHNTSVIVRNCKKSGIEVAGVSKVSCGSVEISQAMIEGGIKIIADSKIENLKKLKVLSVDKMLLRLPMISQAEEVVEYSDISLNSEMKTIRSLSRFADIKNIVHKIILMIDVGDLREGVFDENEVLDMVVEILGLPGIKLIGLGTNLTCFGGVIPSSENLGILLQLKDRIEKDFNLKLDIISGGNSSSYHLIQRGEIPSGINQLRLGTTLMLGLVEINNTRIENTYDDAFRLLTEIIEIKNKPSKPIGKIGTDAFGKIPKFKDNGIRKRAICAIGKQDIDIDWMIPEDKNIVILGSSSDHLILDITDSSNRYEVGDKITFILNYVAILRAMTSQYVEKVYI